MDILLVDDSPTDRMVMQAQLHKALPDACIVVAGEAAEFSDALGQANCDVVVTDYWLGWADGLSVLQRVRKRWPRCRVIFITGDGGEEVVAEAFRYGIHHYLIKPDGFDKLVAVTRAALEGKHREDRMMLLSSIVTSMPHAVYSVDREGLVTSWNSAAAALFGYSAQQILGCSEQILVPPELREITRSLHERVLRGEKIAALDTFRTDHEGTRIEIALALAPIRIDTQSVEGISCVLRPRAELRRGGESFVGQGPRMSPMRETIRPS
ncbi:MAG TPA: response regulator [Candidatus Binataceae bacterium]